MMKDENKKENMPLFYGIDLGTTNSCLVEYNSDDDNIRPINTNTANNNVSPVFPSLVFYHNDKMLVGPDAKSQILRERDNFNPNHVFRNFKTYMGTNKTWDVSGEVITPVTLSTLVLSKIRENAGAAFNPNNVVITCPSSFGDKEKKDIIKAAELAGITIKDWAIVDEPTAAALDYNFGDEQFIIFFDLGGGTLDIDLMEKKVENNKSIYKSIASAGRKALGGKDWDEVLKELIYEKIEKNSDFTRTILENDSCMQMELFKEIENVKIALSTPKEDANFYLPMRWGDLKGVDFDGMVTKSEFENRSRLLLDQALLHLEDILNKEGDKSDKIVLVGGASQMPQMLKGIEDKFPKYKGKVIGHSDRFLSVARGASKYKFLAGIGSIEKQLKYFLFEGDEDNIPLKTLLNKGETLPCESEKIPYKTGSNPQKGLSVEIFKSKDKNTLYSEEIKLATLNILFPEEFLPIPAKSMFWFTYKVDTNEVLTVEVEEDEGNPLQIGMTLEISVKLI